MENGIAALPTIAQRSNHKDTLSQEKELNQENVKININSENTILPSLRNVEWRILKTETNKINQVLPYIPKNNITELNELIYAGAKLICEKIGIPLKSTKKKMKTKTGNSTGNADKKKTTKTGQDDKTKERR